MSLKPAAPANTHPEDEVIRCCVRTRLDTWRADRIRTLLKREMDWSHLIATAVRHGVGPLLYWHLNTTSAAIIPECWKAVLAEHFQRNVRRNLTLTGELYKILELFAARDILAIPYKGPTLAALAYGNVALREFVDLDIVIRQRDIGRAHELLVSCGYRADFDLAAAQTASARIPGQYFFQRRDSQCIVELHTERTLRYFPMPLDLDQLTQHLEAVSVGGGVIKTFSAEDLLTILSVHATKHFWDRLLWTCDIAQLVQISRGVNWDQALEHARCLDCERMLFLGLYLAHEVLDAPLPGDILERLQENTVVKSLAAQAQRRLWEDNGGPPGAVQRFLFRLRMRENLWEGMRYCFRLATRPTEEDWRLFRLPGPLASLYSVVRPLRLLRKYGWGLTRRPPPT